MGRLNKPAKEGYTYRSPGQTNARDTTPNLREDVMASQSADIDRIRRGLDTSSTRPQNRSQVQNAAGRAVTRTGGRAALAGAALEGGYELGKYIDEKTGLGKKMVDKSGLGDLAEEMATPSEKVELSEESKARIARGDLNEKPKAKARADKDSEGGGGGGARSEPKSRTLMENREPKDEAMKRGGITRTSSSKRGDGIATKGFTRGKYL